MYLSIESKLHILGQMLKLHILQSADMQTESKISFFFIISAADLHGQMEKIHKCNVQHCVEMFGGSTNLISDLKTSHNSKKRQVGRVH